MAPGRIQQYVGRVRTELHSSLTEEYSPHQIASSFAIGTFITMLPTWGTGLLLFFVLVYLFDWINKVALFAAVLVFNPVVKWGVYAMSFALGFAILGPVEGPSYSATPSLSDGSAIILRLLLGNTILAIIATVAGYIVAYRVASAYEREKLPVLESTLDQVVEELERQEESLPDPDAETDSEGPARGTADSADTDPAEADSEETASPDEGHPSPGSADS